MSKFSEAKKPKNNYNNLLGEIPDKPLINEVFYGDFGFNPATVSATRNSIITIFNTSPKKSLTLTGPYLSEGKVISFNKSQSIQFLELGTFVYVNSADKSKVTILIQ